jgi:hypothetical protein
MICKYDEMGMLVKAAFSLGRHQAAFPLGECRKDEVLRRHMGVEPPRATEVAFRGERREEPVRRVA